MSRLYNILEVSVVGRLLLPGYPDGARLLAQLPHLRKMLEGHEFQGRVLNAGCGEGLYADFLESFSGIERIDNIDVNYPEAIAKREDRRNRVAAGSLTDLPYENDVFDGVLCTEVIEHIDDHRKAVQELHRVLKPRGILLASVPQKPAPYDPNHVRQGYDVAEFHTLLQQNGFEVLATGSCFHASMRLLMAYWRKPLLRFGAGGNPYMPQFFSWGLAKLDNSLSLGAPWDLCVLASRTP